MERSDIYEKRPSGMDEYLALYGWHFSKKMAQWAAKVFCNDITLMSPEKMEQLTKNTSIPKIAKGYDAYYLAAKMKSIFQNLSELELIRKVEAYLKTEYDSAAFTRLFADTNATATPIIWEDMI